MTADTGPSHPRAEERMRNTLQCACSVAKLGCSVDVVSVSSLPYDIFNCVELIRI